MQFVRVDFYFLSRIRKQANKQTSDEMESWKMRMMSHSFDDDDDDDTCVCRTRWSTKQEKLLFFLRDGLYRTGSAQRKL